MELNNIVNVVAEKVETVLHSLREENIRVKAENDDLLTRLLVAEDELKLLRESNDTAARRLEDLLAKLG